MAETATAKAKVRRNRKPSAFKPVFRVTLSLHGQVAANDVSNPASVLQSYFGKDYAVRVSQRARRKGAKVIGPQAAMVYLAPKGYEFAVEKERGMRLDADTANLLRPIAEAAGITVDELIRRMATKAAES